MEKTHAKLDTDRFSDRDRRCRRLPCYQATPAITIGYSRRSLPPITGSEYTKGTKPVIGSTFVPFVIREYWVLT